MGLPWNSSLPSIVPRSRRRCVSERVSMPVRPGMPCSISQSLRLRAAFQWLYFSL